MSSTYLGLTTPDYADAADVPAAFRNYALSGPIPRFSSESTRNAAITLPAKGMVAFIEVSNQFTYWNGSAWVVMVPPIPALWPSSQITWLDNTIPASAIDRVNAADVLGIIPAVNLPPATTAAPGIVKLTSSLTSTSEVLAATAKAIFDLRAEAVRKNNTALQTMTGALKLPAGAVNAPALEIYDNMGFYRTSAGALGVAFGNAAIFEFNGNANGGFGSPGFNTNSGFTTTSKVGMTWDSDGGLIAAIRPDAQAAFFGRNTNGGVVDFRRSGVQVGTIIVSTTSTSYATSSDASLKEDVQDYSKADALALVEKFKVRDFKWKSEDARGIGLIAQEVLPLFPSVVGIPSKNDNEKGFMSIDYGRLTPLLIAAVQDLSARLKALESTITP